MNLNLNLNYEIKSVLPIPLALLTPSPSLVSHLDPQFCYANKRLCARMSAESWAPARGTETATYWRSLRDLITGMHSSSEFVYHRECADWVAI